MTLIILQFIFITSSECKTLSILKLKATSHEHVLFALIWKNSHKVKAVNVVARIFDRFVGQVSLEISRCCSKSILMKVSDTIIYIMKIMRRDLKKFVRVVSEIYKKVLKVQILNEVVLIQVVRKRVSFQDRKNKNTPKFLASKYDIKQHSDST